MNTSQTEKYINNNRHALAHLFSAIDEYNKILSKAQENVRKLERSKQYLHDNFMYKDQWSYNANEHYGIYQRRLQDIDSKKAEAEENLPLELEEQLEKIGASADSMASLAGSVFQIAKQILSLRHRGKPRLPGCRKIGTQSVVDVIWEGRNHSMPWEEANPNSEVKEMIKLLNADLNMDLKYGENNCLSLLAVLSWSSAEEVIADLMLLTE